MKTIARYFMISLATALVGWSCNNTDKPTPPSPPEPPTPTTYDIDITATHSLGVHYETDGLTSYFLTLADMKINGTADIPIPTGAGNLLVLDIYAKSTGEIMLPEGTYNYTEGALEEFKFANTSKHMKIGADGSPAQLNFFTEAQMIVTKNGNIYTLEVIGKTFDDNQQERTLHTTYTGELKFDPYGGGGGSGDDLFARLDKDIETTFIESPVAYFGKNAKNGHRFEIELKDFRSSQTTIGRVLRVQLFSPTAENMMPAPGTYTVATIYKDLSTYAYNPGELQPGYINNQTLQNKGTHLIDMRDDGGRLKDYYGIVNKGTVVVSQAGDQTTFKIDFTDENKFSIKGSYTGKISVRDYSYHSTLDSDHKIQLASMPGHITYNGQLYLDKEIDANSWVVQVASGADGSDALQLELLAPSSEFSNGLPAGTYTLSSNYTSGEYTALPGRLSGTSVLGSWYLGEMSGNSAGIVAPLKTGKVTVVRSGTACTITIDALDDAPTAHKVTGTWTGTPTYKDAVTQPQAAAYIPAFRTALKVK